MKQLGLVSLILALAACSSPVTGGPDAGMDAATSAPDSGEPAIDTGEPPIDTGGPSPDVFALDAPTECSAPGDCPVAENASARCVSNRCEYDCATGFGNCDDELGCEQPLDVASHCGACTTDCGATGYCERGSCETGPTVARVQTITGLGPDQRGTAVAVRGGDVFTAGYIDGAGGVTFEGMSSSTLGGPYDSWLTSSDVDVGTVGSVRNIVGSQQDVARGIAPIASGLVVVGYVAGYTTSPFTGGPAPGGGQDGFVARYGYDDSGPPTATDVWAGTGVDEVMDVVDAGDGSFYVCGVYSSGARFGGGTAYVPAHGVAREFVVVHYLAGLIRDWATTIHATNSEYCQIAVQAGRVRVVTTFGGDLELAGALGTLHASGALDFALLELASGTGAVVGARQYGGSGTDAITQLASNTSGLLVMSGSTNASIDVGGGAIMAAAGAGEDTFTFAVRPDDSFAWQLITSGVNTEQAVGLAVDEHDNAFVSVRSGSPTFDVGSERLTNTGSSWCGAVVSVDRNGAHRWTRLVPPTSIFAHPSGIAVAASGRVLVLGQFAGTGTIEGVAVDSSGGQDAFLLTIDP